MLTADLILQEGMVDSYMLTFLVSFFFTSSSEEDGGFLFFSSVLTFPFGAGFCTADLADVGAKNRLMSYVRTVNKWDQLRGKLKGGRKRRLQRNET